MSRSGDIAVGMMDQAYFVGRGELLDFLNNLLDLQLTKIEQTASGAIACQLTEYIFPKCITMSRVNWEARSDYEFLNNYKLLQAAFSKHKIQRHIDVDKLIRAKYQDNLEFCQWLKAFYDQSGAERIDYDPSAVRARGKGGKKYNNLLNNTAAKHGSKPLPPGRNRSKVTPTPTSTSLRKAKPQPPTRPATRTTAPRPAPGRPAPAPRPAPAKTTKAPLKASENKTRTAAHTEKVQADAQLMKKNAEMETKVSELETSVLELEKERDFYFEKLRNVELMLQVQHDKAFEGCDLEGVVGNIFKILYATAEEGVDVAEDGELEVSAELDVSAKPDVSADFSAAEADMSAEFSAAEADVSADLSAAAADVSADLSAALVSEKGDDKNILVEDEQLLVEDEQLLANGEALLVE